MKKVLYLFFTAFLYMAFLCITAYAADELPKENSWRYKDGELIKNEYEVSVLSDPYHPDAKYAGIDVSHHQGEINWEKVKAAGVDFAIIRCGYAEDNPEYDDRWWEYNTSECERLDIPYGVYLYSYAESVEDAASEADHVLRLIEGHNLSLPVYYDLEENFMIENGIDLAAVSKTFCERIESAGYPVGVYANLNWWIHYLTDECFDNWYRWVAHWNETCGYEGEYALWQYSSKGAVEGISTNVDMNFLTGNPDDHKIWKEKLAAPQIKLSNNAESGKPKLSWNSIEGAEEYQVWRKIGKNSRYKLYHTTTGTAMANNTAVAGKTYYYMVKAVSGDNSIGDSGYSVQKYITCDLAAPVVTVSNIASTGKIRLTWNAVEGAEKYEVYRSLTGEADSFTKIYTTTGTALTNSSTVTGTEYYYRVKAIHKVSAASSETQVLKATCCLPATTVTATNVASTGKVKLSWAAVEGAEKYEIYRSKTGKEDSFTRIYTTKSTTLTNTATAAGTLYYYRVKAIHANELADSAFSEAVSRRCDLAQPALKVSNVASTGKIKLSWAAVEGADRYRVYRATSKSGEYTLLTTTENTSVINTKTTAGKTYWYKVQAVYDKTSAADSAFSTTLSRTCDLAQPALKVSNVVSTGKIKLSWAAVEGADRYKVYRATSKSGEYTLLTTTENTSVINTKTTAGKAYWYKVQAVCDKTSAADSAFSTTLSRTCDLARPSVAVSYSLAGKPKLSWKKVEGADRYNVYRATSENGEYTLLTTTTKTTVTNTKAVEGKTYWYKVSAVCDETSAANSANSSVVSIKSR